MSWEHLRDAKPVARKQHRCMLCERPIAVGAQHVIRCGISHGEFSSFRMHAACEEATRDWDEMDWECAEFGSTFLANSFESGVFSG